VIGTNRQREPYFIALQQLTAAGKRMSMGSRRFDPSPVEAAAAAAAPSVPLWDQPGRGSGSSGKAVVPEWLNEAVWRRARCSNGRDYCAFCPKELGRNNEEARAETRRINGRDQCGLVMCHGWAENPRHIHGREPLPPGPTIWLNLFPGDMTCNGHGEVDQWEEQASSGAKLTPHQEDMKGEYRAFMTWWEEQRFPALEPFGPDFPRDAKRSKRGAKKSRITLRSERVWCAEGERGVWQSKPRIEEIFLE
jgi:hypothetical protein